jgi:toxin FitB
MNVLDSSGWIEYLLDSPSADLFEPAVLDASLLVVPTIALYEVHKRLSQLVPADMLNQCLDVMRKGHVVDLTDARAIAASTVAQQHKLAFADAAMYAIAREFNATFWTQDIDYDGLTGVKVFTKPPLKK